MKKLDVILINYDEVDINRYFYSDYLSNEDRKSFDKYTHPGVKKEKIVSLYLKRKYIINFYIDENGKPLSDEKCFNISHSHGLIALVIDIVPVGIDVELVRKSDDSLKDFISSKEEREYINDDKSFFEVWTNKEALVKAYGLGIREDIKNIPSLPLNGARDYKSHFYINKTIMYNNYIITVSRQSSEDYEINLIED